MYIFNSFWTTGEFSGEIYWALHTQYMFSLLSSLLFFMEFLYKSKKYNITSLFKVVYRIFFLKLLSRLT